MKISQRELEFKVLKCITTYDNAVFIASEKGIKDYHFLTKEPGADISLTGKLYALCQDYGSNSGGYKLTETVLESLLLKRGVKTNTSAKFLNLWYQVCDQKTEFDEFPHLITLLKERYCVKLMAESVDKNSEFVNNDQIKDAASSMGDYLNAIHEELQDFSKDKESFDMAESNEYFFDEYDKRLDNPDLFKGITCGLSQIDTKTYGWMPNQLIVLLAPTGGGKSVQLLNWGVHANTVCKKKVLYFSFEMGAWLCQLRHISLCSNIEYTKIKSLQISPEEKKNMQESFDRLKDGPYFEYVISVEDPTPEFVEQKIREISNTKGMPDIVIVDYVGNMTTRSTPKTAKHWEKNGDAAEGLFKLCKRYNLPIVTAQQINRDAVRENRKNKEAGKASAYFQDAASGDQRLMHYATYVIGLEPVKEDNIAWYHPVKIRDTPFTSFAARWIPEYNKVVEFNDIQQSEWNLIKSAENNSDIIKPKSNTEIVELNLSDWSVDF